MTARRADLAESRPVHERTQAALARSDLLTGTPFTVDVPFERLAKLPFTNGNNATLLIALLALSRKFVILDSSSTGPATIAALAGATLVLGIVYWLLRERDDRVPSAEERAEFEGG